MDWLSYHRAVIVCYERTVRIPFSNGEILEIHAPAEGKIYAGTLPKCNRCNLHHNGQCSLKCRRCQKLGHQETDCRVRLLGTGDNHLRNNKGAHARAYAVVENPQQNPNVVTELANGKTVSTNTVLRGCTLALFSHMFKIDLLPTRFGSFDVIVGMDWLSYHRAVIVCYERTVRIPFSNGEILEIHGVYTDFTGKNDVGIVQCKAFTNSGHGSSD
nr:hypothetical protein [Tanacetum cinerariifolium]